MKTLPRHLERGDGGFVLVGVIMFVLALTILGLSLYSLSGIEVDFIQDSIARQQAFYDATGGLERAKWILAQQGTLASVKNGIPDGNGVVYARAWRPAHGVQDSINAINWSSPDKISIRVKAVRGNRRGGSGTARCMVECTYTPDEIRSLYKNLLTSSAQISIKADQFKPTLLGNVWQNDPNASWQSQVIWSGGSLSLNGVPDPDVANFINRFPAAPPATFQTLSGTSYYHLESGGLPQGPAHIFKGMTGQQPGENWDPQNLYEVSSRDLNNFIVITGQGFVIWLIPEAIHLRRSVTVVGSSTDCLVIIAGPGGDTAPPNSGISKNIGMWFDGGLVTACPTFLVSDGTVSFSSTTAGTIDASWLSVFAGAIHVHIPPNYPNASFLHPSLLDGLVVDPLVNGNLLPNVDPTQNRRLDKVAGTWSVVTKSDPDN